MVYSRRVKYSRACPIRKSQWEKTAWGNSCSASLSGVKYFTACLGGECSSMLHNSSISLASFNRFESIHFCLMHSKSSVSLILVLQSTLLWNMISTFSPYLILPTLLSTDQISPFEPFSDLAPGSLSSLNSQITFQGQFTASKSLWGAQIWHYPFPSPHAHPTQGLSY